jgi:hypothetical protein
VSSSSSSMPLHLHLPRSPHSSSRCSVGTINFKSPELNPSRNKKMGSNGYTNTSRPDHQQTPHQHRLYQAIQSQPNTLPIIIPRVQNKSRPNKNPASHPLLPDRRLSHVGKTTLVPARARRPCVSGRTVMWQRTRRFGRKLGLALHMYAGELQWANQRGKREGMGRGGKVGVQQ